MLSVPADFEPILNLLKGRIAEALGRPLVPMMRRWPRRRGFGKSRCSLHSASSRARTRLQPSNCALFSGEATIPKSKPCSTRPSGSIRDRRSRHASRRRLPPGAKPVL
jgi:hypothetical protein